MQGQQWEKNEVEKENRLKGLKIHRKKDDRPKRKRDKIRGNYA